MYWIVEDKLRGNHSFYIFNIFKCQIISNTVFSSFYCCLGAFCAITLYLILFPNSVWLVDSISSIKAWITEIISWWPGLFIKIHSFPLKILNFYWKRWLESLFQLYNLVLIYNRTTRVYLMSVSNKILLTFTILL